MSGSSGTRRSYRLMAVLRRLIVGVIVLVVLLGVVVAGAAYWLLAGDGIRTSLERQATAWLGQPVRIESARVQLFPRLGVRLGNVAIGAPAQVKLATVDVSTPLLPLFSRRIEDGSVLIADSHIDMPLPFEIPTGKGASNGGAAV